MGICRKCRSVRVLVVGLGRDGRNTESEPAHTSSLPPTAPTSAGFQGTAADIQVQAREITRINARRQEMMAADTGQPVERAPKRWCNKRRPRQPENPLTEKSCVLISINSFTEVPIHSTTPI
jgi:Clp protease